MIYTSKSVIKFYLLVQYMYGLQVIFNLTVEI